MFVHNQTRGAGCCCLIHLPVLLYSRALQRGGDGAKSDWSCDYLKQRTCGHIHMHRNLLYWLFSCAHRCVVASQTKPSLISKRLFQCLILQLCDMFRSYAHRQFCLVKPFCIGSMADTFVRALSITASLWSVALCRWISERFCMNVAAQPWMCLLFLYACASAHSVVHDL